MAIIKCKMCGGDLGLSEGSTVAECEYCGTVQTVPVADNEKKLTLFSRANRLRYGCEFDKAAGVYESIVAEFPEEAEAYWGLVLCKYGIEYVDDPATGKKIPTCHRSSFDSVTDDNNYDMTLEYADVVARRVYREEAKTIEQIRKGIIEVSSKEDPYDIFICYKETEIGSSDRTLDSVLAQDVYDALTEKGYRVFFSRITLEDKLGVEYEPYIFAALNSAKIMLAFGTDYEHYNAVWVKNEWSRYLKLMAEDRSKHLIPCYKDIDIEDMPKEFRKLQAQDLGKVGAMQDLMRGIEKILPKATAVNVVKETAIKEAVPVIAPDTTAPLLKRAFMFLEDSDWKSANEYCEKVLDIDPENAQAYVGKLMAELRVCQQDQLKDQRKPFDARNNYQKAARFADSVLRHMLEGYLAHIYARLQDAEREEIYQKAISTMRNAEYEEAAEMFASVSGYENSSDLERECLKRHHVELEQLKAEREKCALLAKRIHTNNNFSVGVNEDGTLVNTDPYAPTTWSTWTNLVAVTATDEDIVALRADGTVLCNEMDGNTEFEQMYFVGDWTDIAAISGGCEHIIGLRKDGSVVATGANDNGECDVSDWRNIVQISAGVGFSVGLKKDGTVDLAGNCDGMDEVRIWTDIVAINCGNYHVLGLKANGTVVAAGCNENGQCNVSNWRKIVAISAGGNHSIGVTVNHRVIATQYIQTEEVYTRDWGQYDLAGWTSIVAICAGDCVSLGITSNGHAVAKGFDECGSCYVSDWKLFGAFTSPEEEAAQREAKGRVERLKKLVVARNDVHDKIYEIVQERDSLQGIFTGKRRRELEKQRIALYEEDDRLLSEIRELIVEEDKKQAASLT